MDIKVTRTGGEFSVIINNKKIKKSEELDGLRDKFIGQGVIVKIDSPSEDIRHTLREQEIYNSLSKHDRKYFPKLIKCDTKIGYVVQEYLTLDINNITSNHKRIIRRLAKKYNINDISTSRNIWNWAIDKKTGLPVIFDLGWTSNS